MYEEDIFSDLYKHAKTVENYALDIYKRIQFRWEQMNVENASTDTLIKARKMIQNELDKRLRALEK
jgi:hypothetical protein